MGSEETWNIIIILKPEREGLFDEVILVQPKIGVNV